MKRNDLLDDFDFGDEARDGEPLDEEALTLDPDADSVVVGKYYDQLEANMHAARLRSEGIPCFIANAFSQSMLPNTQSYVSLRVRAEDRDAATEILTDLIMEQGRSQQQPAPSSFWLENGLLFGLLAIIILFLLVSAYLNLG
ncbi:MAG TPA: DUF2007 domain-containing protein [Saprospiraceae bacterium]|nr:DUF2007 domain-containing protein [Saprospiraceae bacterium]